MPMDEEITVGCSVFGRIRRASGALLRGARATLTWLAVITLTTIVQLLLPERRSTRILRHASTNLKNLLNLKLRVLATSAFWLDGNVVLLELLGWALLFLIVLAPAERWLGTRRWIAAVLLAHLGATVITAARLWLLIRLGRQPGSLVSAIDVGVSYGFLGIVGLSTYRFPSRWRWPYAAALAVIFLVILRVERDFVSAGHVAALFIGFACYPLVPSRSDLRVRMGFAHTNRYTLADMRRTAPTTRERDEG
jgi:hypothetical protein